MVALLSITMVKDDYRKMFPYANITDLVQHIQFSLWY